MHHDDKGYSALKHYAAHKAVYTPISLARTKAMLIDGLHMKYVHVLLVAS